jgi:putative transposase
MDYHFDRGGRQNIDASRDIGFANALPVIDGRGRYLDNIFIERLWWSLKQEAVYLHELQDGVQAKRVIKEWISFYNTERPHTALDKRPPDDAFFGTERSQKAA